MAELGSKVRPCSIFDDGRTGVDGDSVSVPSRMDVAKRLQKLMHELYDLMMECGQSELIVSVKTTGKCYSISAELCTVDKSGLADVYGTAKELGWTQKQ